MWVNSYSKKPNRVQMKKHLLLGVACAIAVSAYAQNSSSVVPAEMPKPDFFGEGRMDQHTLAPSPVNYTPMAPSAAQLNKIYIGSSYNGFTLLVSESQVLTYNEDVDVIMFTHRQGIGYPGGSGRIQSTFNLNGDESTWDTSLVITMGASPNLHRYPSGVIYNPIANTNPMQAYSVVAGPITSGAGWDGNFFASARLDSTNIDEQNILISQPGETRQWMARTGMQATDDGKVRILGVDFDYNNTATAWFDGAVINEGTFSPITNDFSWSTTRLDHAFETDGAGDQLVWHLGNMAWSESGQVGYVAYLGVDSTNPQGIWPIVYKTTDFGITWNKLPDFDFTGLSDLTMHFDQTATFQGKLIPFFTSTNGFAMTVDANNNLHLVSQVLQGISLNPDSVNYYNSAIKPLFYDVSTNGTGWDAFFIDSLRTEDVAAADDMAWGLGWDARMQVSRSSDGNVIFYTWMDTDPALSTLNQFPNIKGRARNIAANTTTMVKNFTTGGPYDSDNYWMYVSDKVMVNGSTYEVPVTTSFGPGSDADPFFHYYVDGIDYVASDFVGINENELVNAGFTLSQNMPNPFNGETRFVLNSEVTGFATVTVTNIMGQVVSESRAAVTQGTQVLNFDASDLPAGYYNYSVTVNNNTVSKKILVQ